MVTRLTFGIDLWYFFTIRPEVEWPEMKNWKIRRSACNINSKFTNVRLKFS